MGRVAGRLRSLVRRTGVLDGVRVEAELLGQLGQGRRVRGAQVGPDQAIRILAGSPKLARTGSSRLEHEPLRHTRVRTPWKVMAHSVPLNACEHCASHDVHTVPWLPS